MFSYLEFLKLPGKFTIILFYFINIKKTFSLSKGDIGLPGPAGEHGEKGEKGDRGKRGKRVCICWEIFHF